ncbi:hypothetical protein AMATHDRAFT_6077 [Amanita thiersii Skay4041]|uniref:NB-ARC domain-containing protein n=1 Tax=Amanita thiersii Skay4041 TaxID=703135 RepID=A0A2A9NIR0_9AGAR|nr:hypothetical protein AMATHDRAFT_6077 [Amanita thiersii Skay4041]
MLVMVFDSWTGVVTTLPNGIEMGTGPLAWDDSDFLGIWWENLVTLNASGRSAITTPSRSSSSWTVLRQLMSVPESERPIRQSEGTVPSLFDANQSEFHGIVSHSSLSPINVGQPTTSQVAHIMPTSGFFHHSRDSTIHHGIFQEIHGSQHTTTNVFQPQPRQPSPPVNIHTKHLSSLFTGREEYLEKLRHHFENPGMSKKQRLYLLYGLGGIGKTQICLKFMEELEDVVPYTFWIDASSEDTIISSFKAIVKSTDILVGNSGSSAQQILQEIGKMKKAWFMIYDNADGPPSLVQKYLPQGNKGNIIITSRNGALKRLTSNCGTEVTQMRDDEAVLLLVKAAGFDDAIMDKEGYKEIISKLGCIPLAVDMAGAYMQATQCSPSDYLELFSKEFKKLMNEEEHAEFSDYGYTTYGTWEISMQRIQSRIHDKKHLGPESAIDILHVVAFLHHVDVPLDMFRRAAEGNRMKYGLKPKLLQLDASGSWSQYFFNSGMQELLSFSLIKKDVTQNTLSMHPLVHRWLRDRLPETDVKQKYEEARFILCSSVDPQDIDYGYWLALVPHLKANNEHGGKYKLQEDTQWQLYRMGCVFLKTANYADADYQFQKCLELDLKLGSDYPGLFSSMNNVGTTYHEQGRLDEAEKLLKIVVDGLKLKFGCDHSDTLTCMNNLAMIYQDQGRFDESEKLLKVVIESRKFKLGHDHPDTSSSMNNLALTYHKQGRLAESEELYQLVVESSRQKLGYDHPDTLITMNNLVQIYMDQGKWDESEALFRHAVQTLEMKLGHDHPHTLNAMSSLASCYQKQSKWDESEKLLKVVIESSKLKLGHDHPITLHCINTLAQSYYCEGRWEESEKLFQLVVESRILKLGPDHYDTLYSMQNLASTFHYKGRWNESEKLFKEVLEVLQVKFENNHPLTLRVMNNLAVLYCDQGKWDESEKLLKEVVEQGKLRYGLQHPKTVSPINNLAKVYEKQGNWVELEKLLQEIVEERKLRLGYKHPDTLSAMDKLALSYEKQWKWVQAKKLLKVIVEERKLILELYHPDTLSAMDRLAITYEKQGRWDKSEKLLNVIFDEIKLKLGPDHPDTLTSMNNLAVSYRQQEKWDESEKLFDMVIESRKLKLGHDHPSTLITLSNLASSYLGQGRWHEAEKVLEEVVEKSKLKLGHNHPHTLEFVHNLARVYRHQGRWEESDLLLKLGQ